MIWTVLKLAGLVLIALAVVYLLLAILHKGLIEYRHYQWDKRRKEDEDPVTMCPLVAAKRLGITESEEIYHETHHQDH